jgi:ATP-binding cassette subfamily B protein
MAAITRGLDAEAYDRQYGDQELIRRILSYFQPYRRKVVIICLAIFLMAAASAAVRLIISNGVNFMVESGRGPLSPFLAGVIFFTAATIWATNWIRRQLTAELIADAILAIRQDGFKAAAHQDLSFYDEYSTGRIVSRITNDTQELGEVITLSTDVVNQLFVTLILVGLLFGIEWRLTVAVLAMAPLVTFVALAFRRIARQVTRQSTRAIAEVNTAIQEAVSGIRVAKNFRQERAIYEAFAAVNQQAYSINVRRAFVLANIFPILNVLSGIGTALLVYFGGASAISGIIGIAAWYLFVATVDRFWFPVMNLSAFWSQFQAGLAAAERVFALMDVSPAVVQTGQQLTPPLRGEIVFNKVSFRYSTQEQILRDFDLTIAPGESIALVGHTGAGKSSLAKLIARFYEFQSGEIRVDGLDLRQLDLTSYRRQLGIVSQVPFLFAGSVAENIRYGRPEAGDDEIEAMAQAIGEGEWLGTLPAGLGSPVGERGVRLSMGQRQLVALTRVLVQAPRIFILDEATASVDPFTESQIQQALSLIMSNSTSIIIAHRLSTVRSASRIIVLQKGKIIEQGNHKQLMSQGGHYAELYDTYFRHQAITYIEGQGWRKVAEEEGTTAD